MGGISLNLPERPVSTTPHPVREGTTTERGYGVEHQRLRASWKARIQRGEEPLCFRCHKIIYPDAPGGRTGWHLDHDDDDRSLPARPSHWFCNLRAARAVVRTNPFEDTPPPRTRSEEWDQFDADFDARHPEFAR